MNDSYVTIADIIETAPVCDRTIRNWVREGLLPRPELVSDGYRQGVIGYYPPEAVETARILFEFRHMPMRTRRELIQRKSRMSYSVEEDGTIVVTIKAKSAFGGEHDG